MKNLSLIFIFLFSCIVVVEDGGKRKIPRVKERKLIPVLKTVSIECPSGDLQIYGWDKDSIDLNYEILEGNGDVKIFEKEDETEIKVIKSNDGEFNIDMTVRVPLNYEIKVEVGTGKILAQDLSGKTDIQLGAGSIEIKDLDGSLKIETGAGKITTLFEKRVPDEFNGELGLGEVEIIIREDANLKFEAECGIGKIETEFEFDEFEEKGFFIGNRVEGVRGEGESIFKIDVGVGKVSLFTSE